MATVLQMYFEDFRQLKTKGQNIPPDSHCYVYVLSFLQGNTVL